MKNIVIMGKNNSKYNYREPKNSSTAKREKKSVKHTSRLYTNKIHSKHEKMNKLKNIIYKHIVYNIKEYIGLLFVFLIGVILGVLVINKTDIETQKNVNGYIQAFIDSIKSNQYRIDINVLLQTSIFNNIKLVVLLWFIGSTVIGMPLLYGVVGFRGYCLGYTISAVVLTLGSGKGLIFVLSSLFLQNIIFIPSLFALSISGTKLYKAIMQDRRKENIKIEIYKHSMFSIIILVVSIVAAVIETYGSGNLIMFITRYI